MGAKNKGWTWTASSSKPSLTCCWIKKRTRERRKKRERNVGFFFPLDYVFKPNLNASIITVIHKCSMMVVCFFLCLFGCCEIYGSKNRSKLHHNTLNSMTFIEAVSCTSYRAAWHSLSNNERSEARLISMWNQGLNLFKESTKHVWKSCW